MKRIITRLILARLAPIAIKAVTKAFRNRKPKAKLDNRPDVQNLDAVDNKID